MSQMASPPRRRSFTPLLIPPAIAENLQLDIAAINRRIAAIELEIENEAFKKKIEEAESDVRTAAARSVEAEKHILEAAAKAKLYRMTNDKPEYSAAQQEELDNAEKKLREEFHVIREDLNFFRRKEVLLLGEREQLRNHVDRLLKEKEDNRAKELILISSAAANTKRRSIDMHEGAGAMGLGTAGSSQNLEDEVERQSKRCRHRPADITSSEYPSSELVASISISDSSTSCSRSRSASASAPIVPAPAAAVLAGALSASAALPCASSDHEPEIPLDLSRRDSKAEHYIKRCNRENKIHQVSFDSVMGKAHPSASLRAYLRYMHFVLIARTDVSHISSKLKAPNDDEKSAQPAQSLKGIHEKLLQPVLLEVLQAAAGDQQELIVLPENKSEEKPRPDARIRAGNPSLLYSSIELKKIIALSPVGNKIGLGQLWRYGGKDSETSTVANVGTKSKPYLCCLSSVAHCVFALIEYDQTASKHIVSMSIAPPLNEFHKTELFKWADLASNRHPRPTWLQQVLPQSCPQGFKFLVRYVDSLCIASGTPITQPIFYALREGSRLPLELKSYRILSQSKRSLILGVRVSCNAWPGLIDSASAGNEFVIKLTRYGGVMQEAMIHHAVDRLPGIRRMLCRVVVSVSTVTAPDGHDSDHESELHGLLLILCQEKVEHLPANVDGFLREANELLDRLHSAGVLHRDVKAGNLLRHDGQLFINDFDVSEKRQRRARISGFWAAHCVFVLHTSAQRTLLMSAMIRSLCCCLSCI